ncbi:putative strubbelig receptor [Tripterygium wilfordii]|uniref:Putative strubbelig receptor n=1 Tax=Tripterygium wilfordii TaxID=458696 RepID=A0A7J7D5L1_TRIWF|nr:putative strubbelig receptor [Tripterygium wilfordii]
MAKRSTSIHATAYSLVDLQTATANFATYPDGKVLAVKKIDSSLFHGGKGEEFSAIISNISRVHHPSIAELFGYCSEQGHYLLIYEYFRNGSLHDFLHLSDDFSKPLTWNTRVGIALGTARAVDKKPKSEQSLVRWATPQLHDIDALSKIVDPALRGLYPPKSLSRFADVIALCV